MKPVRLKGKAMRALRMAVFERDEYTCQMCGIGVTWERGHLSHKKSRGAGGADTADNCEVLCEQCHLEGVHRPKSVPKK